MPDAHTNFAYSTVATAPSPATSGTSLVVASGSGGLFPAVPFNAMIWPAGVVASSTTAEIVRVTARSTDTLTITRAQESTSARTVVVGDQIAAGITVKTLTDLETNGHFVAPVVDSGGLKVTAGNVSIGGAVDAGVGVYVQGAISAGTSVYGSLFAPVAGSGTTTEVDGVRSQPGTAASAFTSLIVAGFRALTPVKGAGSSITQAFGLLVDSINTGNTDNIGVDVATPSGGSGLNLSIRASGAVRFSGLGAFAASDKYVIIDASGNLHKSALGPAS